MEDESKTTGLTFSAFGFKNKIDFLLDVKILTINEHKFLNSFLELRNKLVHNLEIKDIYDAAESAGLSNGFRKKFLFKDSNLSDEENINLSMKKIKNFVILILTNVVSKVTKELRAKAGRMIFPDMNNNLWIFIDSLVAVVERIKPVLLKKGLDLDILTEVKVEFNNRSSFCIDDLFRVRNMENNHNKKLDLIAEIIEEKMRANL